MFGRIRIATHFLFSWLPRWSWGRACLCICLIGLGGALWAALPPAPRWRAPGRCEVEGFVPGKDVVVTYTPRENVDEEDVMLRRFSWWDLNTGQELRFVETDCSYHAFSPDYRLLAAGAGKDLWIIHTESGRRVDVPGEWKFERYVGNDISFSSSGRLMSHISSEPFVLNVVDTETGEKRKQTVTGNYQAHFMPDSEWVVYIKEVRGGDRIHFWDGGTSQIVHRLGPYDGDRGYSPTGRFYIGARGKSNGPVAGSASVMEVFDLKAGRKLFEFPCRNPNKEWFSRYSYSKDEQRFGVQTFDRNLPRWEIAFWDIASKKRISSVQPASNSNDGQLSPDGSLFAFYHIPRFQVHYDGQSPPFHLQMFEVATGRELWNRTSSTGWDLPVVFTSDSRRFCVNESNHLAFYDARTGILLDSFPCFRDHGFLCPTNGYSWVNEAVLPYPRYAVLARQSVKRTFIIPWLGSKLGMAETDEITVADVEEQRILAQLRLEQRASSKLCERGPVLVTCHRQGEHWHLAAWDLPPARPWLAIAGIPVMVGVALVGMRTTYRRWRGRLAKNP